jgi:SprT protein
MTGTDIREYVELTCATCGVPELAAKILVRWNPRFTARMGDAKWFPAKDRGVIRLSVPLWPKASPEDRIETVVHETCHIIAEFQFGVGQGHGPKWRALMRRCGYENASRCHTVNRDEILARRRQTRQLFKVACGCPNGVMLGRVQFHRLRTGTRYHCRRCQQGVRLE